MKIAYLSGTEIPSRAASSLHVVKMCNALAGLGHEVVVFAVGAQGQQSVAEFYGFEPQFELRAYTQSRLPGGGYRFAARVLLDVVGEGFDVFYGRHPHALLACSVLGKPFAYEAHAVPQDRSSLLVVRGLVRRSNCRGVVCITQTLAGDLGVALAPYARFHVRGDAADPAPDETSVVEDWPGRGGVPQIGYVGHLYPGKGMEMVWRIAQRMPGLDFHVIGGREADIQHWRGQGELPNVYFHGFRRHAELSGRYRRLDVALLPLQEAVWTADEKTEIGRWTSPLKAFEYMAYGLPIVASDTPALREIFAAERTALLVDSDDVAGWCAAISRLAEDRAFARTLGNNALQTFTQSHTWAHRAESIMGLLE